MCNAFGHSASCTCGFGGEGHLGQASDLMNSRSSHQYLRFCKSTACKYCGQQVFFVSHNEGFVCFDSLGKPWPKHDCYYNEEPNFDNRSEFYGRAYRWLHSFVNPLLATVTEVAKEPNDEQYALITSSDDRTHLLRVNQNSNIDSLINALVVISLEQGKMLNLRSNEETPIVVEVLCEATNETISQQLRILESYVKCHLCNLEMHSSELENHIVEHYNKSPWRLDWG